MLTSSSARVTTIGMLTTETKLSTSFHAIFTLLKSINCTEFKELSDPSEGKSKET